jgi:tetratricopeptide (TPR) repeat protein
MKPAFSALGCGLFALFVTGTVLSAEDDPGLLFARGVRLQQAGDTLGAIEAYQNVLEIDPDRVDARSNLGAAFARLGRYDEAAENYQEVLKRVPDQVQVRFNLALARYKAERIPEAAEDLQRVVDKDPGHRNALLLLADCRSQMGDDAGVVSLLQPHEAEFKDDRLFAYLLGNALIRRNELLRGQAYIDLLFKGGESVAEGHLLLGAAHVRRDENQEAVTELEKAVELKPDLPRAHSLLGRALLGIGRREEAVQAFEKEVKTNPNDFDANLFLGILLKDENKTDQAYAHLVRATRLRSQDPQALCALGSLQLTAGRPEEAQKLLEAAIAQAPKYREAHVLLAYAYYRQKNKELGDRERNIAESLRAEQQAKEPGAADDLGPAYRGDQADATPPSTAPDATSSAAHP